MTGQEKIMKLMISAFAALVLFGVMMPAADDALQTNGDALRAAVEGKKPAAEIKRLAVLVFSEAKKQMGPAPADADKANWEERSKYAQSLAEYAEYALYSAATSATGTAQSDLVSALETEAPKSKYLTQDIYLVIA